MRIHGTGRRTNVERFRLATEARLPHCIATRVRRIKCHRCRRHRRFDANYAPTVRHRTYRYILRYWAGRLFAYLPAALPETFFLQKVSFYALRSRSPYNIIYSVSHLIENRRSGVSHANRIIHKSLGMSLGSLPRNFKPTLHSNTGHIISFRTVRPTYVRTKDTFVVLIPPFPFRYTNLYYMV
jgi:hypothetical protein